VSCSGTQYSSYFCKAVTHSESDQARRCLPSLTRLNAHTRSTPLYHIKTDTIATGSDDKLIKIWLISTGTILRTINTGQNVHALKSGSYLAAGLDISTINIYNINTGSLVYELKGHTSGVNDLITISDDLLASASFDRSVRIWSLATNATKFILNGHSNSVKALKLISSSILASGSSDKQIIFWDITNGINNFILPGHSGTIQYSFDMLNEGPTFVSGSLDRTIKLWDINTTACLNTITTGLSIISLAVLDQNLIIQVNSNKNIVF
jgi:WD40 repeat protein